MEQATIRGAFCQQAERSEGEAAETITWLDFAYACEYLAEADHDELRTEYRKTRGGLLKMMRNPDPWCGPSPLREPDIPYETDTDP